jgi:hypothetical protein
LREKEKFLVTEIENLKDKLRTKDDEKKECYTREDKMQR